MFNFFNVHPILKIRLLSFLVFGGLLNGFTYPSSAQEVDFTSSDLPIIVIDTRGQEIPPESPRIRADMGIIWNGPGQRNHLSDPFNDYDGMISIKSRGSSSSIWPKKSYSIETEKPDSSNKNVPLLGMPKENDWVLYAPYYDRSLMRNVFTYRMMESWGHYAPRTRYCELVLNGEYQGIYVLTEKIKREKQRVNIEKMNEDDNAGDSLTGGYIFKLDKESWKPGFDGKYKTTPAAPFRMHYQYVYPKTDQITDQQENYIRNYFWSFENTIHDTSSQKPDSGYLDYLDVSSFVDYFLINELAKNVDGYSFSCYFHKDRDSKGGKITIGPVWDYNFGYGDVSYNDAKSHTGWMLIFLLNDNESNPSDPHPVPAWWNKLIHDSLFIDKVIARWHDLRQSLLTPDKVNTFLDTTADTLSEAQQRNFALWIKGDSNFSYYNEVDYLKWWINKRMTWIDENIGALELITGNRGPENSLLFHLDQSRPNPFTDRTTITYEIPSLHDVQMKIYSLTGRLVATLVDEKQVRGRYEVVWQPRGLPAGIYIVELRAGPHRTTRKISVIR